MNKDLFDHAIGEVPPSTVDVDAAIAHERRAAWVRRVANPWVATAAGVVAVTFGVAAAIMPGAPGAVDGASPSSTATSSTATATAAPPFDCLNSTPTAPPTTEDPAAAATRLSTVLTGGVRRYLPDADLGTLAFTHNLSPGEEDGTSCRPPQDNFNADAKVVDAAGLGNLSAFVGRLGGAVNTLVTECDTPDSVTVGQTACARENGPNGELILSTTLESGEGAITHRIDVSKPDGTGVILIAENVATAKQPGPAQRPTPPLSHEQLIEIALDAGMTLYPSG